MEKKTLKEILKDLATGNYFSGSAITDMAVEQAKFNILQNYIPRDRLSVERLAQISLDTMMKEQERNTDKRYHKAGYKITKVCSCGHCLMSYLIATELAKELKR